MTCLCGTLATAAFKGMSERMVVDCEDWRSAVFPLLRRREQRPVEKKSYEKSHWCYDSSTTSIQDGAPFLLLPMVVEGARMRERERACMFESVEDLHHRISIVVDSSLFQPTPPQLDCEDDISDCGGDGDHCGLTPLEALRLVTPSLQLLCDQKEMLLDEHVHYRGAIAATLVVPTLSLNGALHNRSFSSLSSADSSPRGEQQPPPASPPPSSSTL